jgi:hypothetical protein
MQAPLAVADSHYRSRLLKVFETAEVPGRRVISIGAGNGCMEAELMAAGWDVLATDIADSALAHCQAKGLATAKVSLGEESNVGTFDVIYCDGVLGHLWEPGKGVAGALEELGQFGHTGSICITSNDLSDDDDHSDFAVRGSPTAAFYRPPAGHFGVEATETGLWKVQHSTIYPYSRSAIVRRREILLLSLLVDEGVVPKDGS